MKSVTRMNEQYNTKLLLLFMQPELIISLTLLMSYIVMNRIIANIPNEISQQSGSLCKKIFTKDKPIAPMNNPVTNPPKPTKEPLLIQPNRAIIPNTPAEMPKLTAMMDMSYKT